MKFFIIIMKLNFTLTFLFQSMSAAVWSWKPNRANIVMSISSSSSSLFLLLNIMIWCPGHIFLAFYSFRMWRKRKTANFGPFVFIIIIILFNSFVFSSIHLFIWTFETYCVCVCKPCIVFVCICAIAPTIFLLCLCKMVTITTKLNDRYTVILYTCVCVCLFSFQTVTMIQRKKALLWATAAGVCVCVCVFVSKTPIIKTSPLEVSLSIVFVN